MAVSSARVRWAKAGACPRSKRSSGRVELLPSVAATLESDAATRRTGGGRGPARCGARRPGPGPRSPRGGAAPASSSTSARAAVRHPRGPRRAVDPRRPSRCRHVHRRLGRAPTPARRLDVVGQLQRRDLQEGIGHQGLAAERPRPVVVALREVAHRQGSLAGRPHAVEAHRAGAVRDHLHLGAGGLRPASSATLMDVLGVVADGPAELTHLLDVLVRVPRRATGELGQGHGPQSGVQQLQGAGVARGGCGPGEALAPGGRVPERRRQRDARGAVAQQAGGVEVEDRLDRRAHDRDRLVVRQQDVRAESREGWCPLPSRSSAPLRNRAPSSDNVRPCANLSAGRVYSNALIRASCSSAVSCPWKHSAADSMVAPALHQRGVGGEERDARADPDEPPPGHCVQRVLVHVVEVGLGELGRS